MTKPERVNLISPRAAGDINVFGLSFRSPRTVALLNPFELPIVVALVLVSITFTIWPDLLDHAPVSFEQRGIVHHFWHYGLLLGSLVTLAGMMAGTWRLRLVLELAGTSLLVGALSMNIIAVTAATVAHDGDAAVTGLGLAVRSAVMVGFIIRAYILVSEPTVELVQTERP